MPRIIPLRRWIVASTVLIATVALAQDVTVSPIEWTNPAHAPDQLPVFKKAPDIPYPDELRDTSEFGYIFFQGIVDEKGEALGFRWDATLPSLARVYALQQEHLRFTPARREGQAVNASVTFALICNPRSARADGPEATPRLLQAAPVRVRPGQLRPTPTLEMGHVVYADVTVDTEGRISAVRNVPPSLQHLFDVAAKNWVFSPARHLGQPVEGTVRVPFVLVPKDPGPSGKKQVQPKVIRQTKPTYPYAMLRSGLRGEVLVDFVVDIEGRSRNAFVVRSLNPAFDDSALEAVRDWRFEPGRMDGIPVNTHMQVPIVFQLEGERDGGSSGIEVTKRGDLSKLPPQYQYDVEPRIRASARPVYPYSALVEKREGKARVIYVIDVQGRVTNAKVADASSPEFGAALLAAVDHFAYEPALKAGRPCPAMMIFEQEFNRSWVSGTVSEEDLDMLRREQKRPQTILGARDMDEKLKPLSRQPPIFPESVADKFTKGQAMIEFIIDEDGRVRLPRIKTATADAFGYAAMQALSHWQFERPTRGGKSIAVRVQAPFDFQLKEANAAPAAKPKE